MTIFTHPQTFTLGIHIFTNLLLSAICLVPSCSIIYVIFTTISACVFRLLSPVFHKFIQRTISLHSRSLNFLIFLKNWRLHPEQLVPVFSFSIAVFNSAAYILKMYVVVFICIFYTDVLYWLYVYLYILVPSCKWDSCVSMKLTCIKKINYMNETNPQVERSCNVSVTFQCHITLAWNFTVSNCNHFRYIGVFKPRNCL